MSKNIDLQVSGDNVEGLPISFMYTCDYLVRVIAEVGKTKVWLCLYSDGGGRICVYRAEKVLEEFEFSKEEG